MSKIGEIAYKWWYAYPNRPTFEQMVKDNNLTTEEAVQLNETLICMSEQCEE